MVADDREWRSAVPLGCGCWLATVYLWDLYDHAWGDHFVYGHYDFLLLATPAVGFHLWRLGVVALRGRVLASLANLAGAAVAILLLYFALKA